MLKGRNLSYRFTGQDNFVFEGVSFEAPRGIRAAISGPNGAGKSTLLKLIASLLMPTTGQIELDGRPILSHMDEYRSRVRWVATGSAGFYPRLSGLENLEFYAAIMATGMKKGDLEGVLKEFALLEHRDKRVHQYSTGMKQRLNLARAVLAPAHVVLLDEPTTGLDESGISLLDGLINSHWRDATVLIVSHDQEWCSRHANVHWRLDRRELQV